MADAQLQLRLSADGSGLTGTLRSASGELRNFASEAKSAGAEAERSFAAAEKEGDKMGAAIVKTVSAIIGATALLVEHQINLAAELDTTSKRLGVTTEELSALGAAARRNDADLKDVVSGLDAISDAAVRAATASGTVGKEARAGFTALQVSVRDANTGALKPSVELMQEVAVALARLPDGAVKARIETALFGQSGKELNATLGELASSGLQGVIDKAAETGQVISTEAAARAKAFKDDVQALQAQIGTFGQSIAQDALPTLLALAGVLLDTGSKAKETGADASTLRSFIEGLGKGVVVTTETFKVLFTMLYGGVDIIGGVGDMVNGLLSNLLNATKSANAFFSGNLVEAKQYSDAAGKALADGWEKGSARISSAWENIKSAGADADAEIAKYDARIKQSYSQFGNVVGGVGPIIDENKAKTDANAEALRRLQEALARTTKGHNDHGAAIRAEASSMAALSGFADSLAAKVGGPLDEAWQKYENALARADQLAENALIHGNDITVVLEEQNRAYANAAAVRDEAIDQYVEESDVVQNAIDKLDDEIEAHGKSADAIKAEQVVREANAKAQRLGIDLSAQAKQKLQDEAAARYAVLQGMDYADKLKDDVTQLQAEIEARGKLTPLEQAELVIQKLMPDLLKGEADKRKLVVDEITKHAIAMQRLQSIQSLTNSVSSVFDSATQSVLNGENAFTALGNSAVPVLKQIGQAMIDNIAANKAMNNGLLDSSKAIDDLGTSVVAALPAIGQFVGLVAGGGGENAAIGSSVGSVIGGVIGSFYGATAAGAAIGGAIGGLIGGAFDHERNYEARVSGGNLPDEQSAEGPFGTINAGQYGDNQDPDLVGKIRDFDKIVAGILPPELLQEVTDRIQQFNGSFASVDDLLAARFQVVLDSIDPVIGQFVTDFSSDLQTRIQALADVFALKGEIDGGGGLGVDLQTTLNFINEFGRAGERVAETFQRIQKDVLNWDSAMGLMGYTMEGTREDVIRFAETIAEAAGGSEQAQKLWSDYFKNYYGESEAAAIAVEQAQERSNDALTGLGLDATTSMQEFRTAFERNLPNLTPEQIAQWLRAAEALSSATIAQEQYTAAVAKATADYAGFIADLAQQANSVGSISGFQAARLQIQSWEAETIQQANELARAAGLQGASEEDLALIHQIAAQKIAAAIKVLRDETADLVAQLYGGGGGAGAANDAMADWGNNAVSQIHRVDDAQRELYENQLRGIQSIQDYLVQMQFGDLSGLSPEQQLAEARRQLTLLQQRALGGDADAMSQLPQMAQTFLQLLRGSEASGADYNAGYDWVRQLLQGVVANGTTVPPPGNETGIGGGHITTDYLDQRDQRIGEQEATNRAILAEQLVQHLHDLSEALNVPVLELAEQMHVPLTQLATDLGIDLQNITGASVEALANMATQLGIPLGELVQGLGLQLPDLAAGIRELTDNLGIDLTNLTAETAGQLADLATSMGVNLKDLSEALGIDLGKLTDVNSPIFQALSAKVGEIGGDTSTELQPYLDAVADATSEEEKNKAVKALRDHVDQMAPEIKNQLAPFFDDIVPDGAADQLDYLNRIAGKSDDMASDLAAARSLLGDISEFLKDANKHDGVPGYAIGSAGIPYDHLALVHQGEKIIDAQSSAILDRYGIRVTGSAANDDEVRALRAEVRALHVTLQTFARDNAGGQRAIREQLHTEGETSRLQQEDLARRSEANQRSRRYG